MEWLTGGDFVAPALGITGTGITITAAIWYVVKFVHAFTERLEDDAKASQREIRRLKYERDLSDGRFQRANRRLGHALFLLAQAGIPWVDPIVEPLPPPPPTEDDPEDDEL